MKWINCEEELPPCDGEYFFKYYRDETQYHVGYYDGYGFKDRFDQRTLEKTYGKIIETKEQRDPRNEAAKESSPPIEPRPIS